MYNLEQLRMFVESAELGSFSACARKLGKVQSAISQGIANLEIDLNIQLFDRTTRKPSLTPEGKQLFTYAEAVLRQTEELNTAVQAVERGDEAIIRLALDNALFVPALGKILQEFGETFPATAIEVIYTPSTDVISHIKKQRADLGLMFSDLSFKQDVQLGFIGHVPFHAVCNPVHALAKIESVNVSDLIPHRQLVLRGEIAAGFDQFTRISAEIWWANSFHAIEAMVKQGIGWAYIPCHLVDEAIKNKELVQLPLSFDHKPWSLSVDLIRAKNQNMGTAQSWLHERLTHLLDATDA
ncbi:MAG: LysR family transcriptional regulator [Sneathiella sp.]